MSPHLVAEPFPLAQTTENSQSFPVPPSATSNTLSGNPWLLSTIILLIMIAALAGYGQWRIKTITKALNFEKFKRRDLKKKLKLALVTIRKMEENPDLVYAREFNLDYLRMRMDEEVFHYVVINQIKMKVNQLISASLRPGTDTVQVGIVPGSRQINESFDVTYEVQTQESEWHKGVLFRIQIKLTKLPTQSSAVTVSQIMECIENFIVLSIDSNHQPPAIQGQLVFMDWDQKAKPTPLLVLEQLEEGINTHTKTQTLHKNLSTSSHNSSEVG